MKRTTLTAVLAALFLQVSIPFAWAETADWKVDDKVEVEENGTWYPSVILKTGDGKWFIHYDGYQSQYDLWVGPDRVRPIGSPDKVVDTSALKVGDSVRVWHNGNGQFAWMAGTIRALQDGKFQIHYGGSRYNLAWFGPEVIKGTKEQVAAAEDAKIDTFTKSAFAAFEQKVAALESVAKGGGSASAVLDAIGDAEQALTTDYGRAGRHPAVKPVLERYWAYATRVCDADVQEAVAKTKAAKDLQHFKGQSPGSLIEAARKVQEAYLAFRGAPDTESKRMETVIADAQKVLDAATARFAAAELAGSRAPSEKYSGGDKAALKAKLMQAWKQKFPKLAVIKIVADSPWKRDRYWNTSSGHAYFHDDSSILMYVIAKKDATTATCYPVGVSYHNGDRSGMTADVGDRGYGRYVPYDVLLKNVK